MKKLGKIKVLTISALAAIALAGSIAIAQTVRSGQQEKRDRGAWGEGRGWDGHEHGGMFRGLNLTDDQKTRLQQLHQSFDERTKPLRDQLQAKRQELRAASEGSTFDEALATQKLQEMAGLQAKLMGEEFKQRQEMLSILTPEQKTQWEQKRAEFKNKRGEGNERRDE
ncbi:MAG TPA: Spy/CpxP family protein refolding chaperone [Pyrinomonadaceae bacterium]